MADTWCRTTFIVSKMSFLWKIDNLSFCDKRYIESEHFFCDQDPQTQWRLRLYPYGKNEKNGTTSPHTFMSLYLLFVTDTEKDNVVADLRVFVIDNQDRKILMIKDRVKTYKKETEYGALNFMSRYDVFGLNGNHMLFDDTLSLYCEVNMNVGIMRESGQTLKIDELVASSLPVDFANLLDSGEYSDVTFIVGQRQFKAHKFILAARSPVLAAMFKHEMIEKNRNRVETTDMEPAVFDQMLRFLYTGTLAKDHDIETAMNLLAAADKYDIRDLKGACEKTLSVAMTVADAVDILQLADKHGAEVLKTVALEFVRVHWERVKTTEGWAKITGNVRELIKYKCQNCRKWSIQ